MKRERIFQFLSFTLILLAVAVPIAASSAETYMVTSYTIDGGGELYSDNGRFTLGATVGQPDATGLQSEDRFALVGGFWGVSLFEKEQTVYMPYLSR